MFPNRKRNIHLYTGQEYGQEDVKNLLKWERIEKKMADFKKSQEIFTKMPEKQHHTS